MNHFCKQASKLASDISDRSLNWKERLSLRLHLFMCSVCRKDMHNSQLLSRLFEKIRNDDSLDTQTCLPKDKRENIQQHLSQACDKKPS